MQTCKNVESLVIISSKKLIRHCHDTYRYGGARADRTRLPMAASEDQDDDNDEGNFFEANVKLERSECLRKEGNVRFNYYSIADTVPTITYLQSWAAYHSQGFEDKNLGSSPGLLGQ